MQFTYALLALAAAVATNAQSIPDIPSCALNCFTGALTSDGCAGLTDFKCHCSKPALISTITPCVAKACSAADQAKVQAAVVTTCQQAGVPINLPPASSAPASPITASSSIIGASSSSTTPVAGPTFTSSPTMTMTMTSTAATTAAPTSSESANASSVTPFSGRAAHVQGALGGVAAALFAAAYYL